MIKGIGVDVVQIPRIEKIYLNYKNHFISRILSPKETEIFNNIQVHLKVAYLAKRFAAKEAVAKAIGKGIGNLAFKDIEIINEANGAPKVNILKENSGIKGNIHISLSDDYPVVVAFAVYSHYNISG